MRRALGLTALTLAVGLVLGACGGSDDPATTSAPKKTAAPSTSVAASTAPSSTAATTAAASATPRTTTAARPSSAAKRQRSTPAPKTTAKPDSARRLPLDLATGSAEQVITVVSSSGGDTTATLQRWKKSGTRWSKVGGGVDAYVGSDGIGKASESRSKTPAGSFTLTRAFGRDSDPGTRLPYLRTTPDDYWISSPGSKYNTEQRCGDCGYNDGTNERLYYVTPEYRHAVVIDYNTANAPGGVTPGAGSAFFLHVANGEPTAGCVAIPSGELTDVMTWLRPSAHPRILIGVV